MATWKDYISENLTPQKESELRLRLKTPHKFTKLMKDPTNATNQELLVLSDVFKHPPIALITQFEVGIKKLSYEEKRIYNRLWSLEEQLSKLAAA